MKQQEYGGLNSIKNLGSVLWQYKPKIIFLVTGKNSYEKSGAKNAIGPILSGYKVTHFNDFEVSPKLRDIENGVNIFKENNCDFVIAVGGGSVMDVAKSVNIFAANDKKPEDYVKDKEIITNKGRSLVAIPTTAGSGSEATHFAVVYIDKIKYSLGHEFILPDYAIVDPQFTMSLPKHQTASTGMDVLSQAIESYWAVNSTEESQKYAEKAIKLVLDNLELAVNDPTPEVRIAMAKAANLAGKAINISKTTACHAISYPLTSYFGIPHGHAVALTLGEMFVFNNEVGEENCLDKRGSDYVRRTIGSIVSFFGKKDLQATKKAIEELLIKINLGNLEDLGINEEGIETVTNNLNSERMRNNPRRVKREDVKRLLLKLL